MQVGVRAGGAKADSTEDRRSGLLAITLLQGITPIKQCLYRLIQPLMQ